MNYFAGLFVANPDQNSILALPLSCTSPEVNTNVINYPCTWWHPVEIIVFLETSVSCETEKLHVSHATNMTDVTDKAKICETRIVNLCINALGVGIVSKIPTQPRIPFSKETHATREGVMASEKMRHEFSPQMHFRQSDTIETSLVQRKLLLEKGEYIQDIEIATLLTTETNCAVETRDRQKSCGRVKKGREIHAIRFVTNQRHLDWVGNFDPSRHELVMI